MADLPFCAVAGAVVVWDFDWSLVNENSDTWIFKQLAGPATQALMQDRTVQWTRRCDRAALSLQLHDGVSVSAIVAAFRRLPIFPEHLQAVRELHAAGVRQFIVSDANTVFIEAFLEAHGLAQCFAAIVSNRGWLQSRATAEAEAARLLLPAHGVPLSTPAPGDAAVPSNANPASAVPAHGGALEPVLRIAAYHEHVCPTAQCPENMCKGRIVRHELFAFGSSASSDGAGAGGDGDADTASGQGAGDLSATGGPISVEGVESANVGRGGDSGSVYSSTTEWPAGPIAYVGDGTGDLCAARALRPTDTLLVRRGFRLDMHLERENQRGRALRSSAVAGTGPERKPPRSGGSGGGDSGSSVAAAPPPPPSVTGKDPTTAEAPPRLLRCEVQRWDGGADLRRLLFVALGLPSERQSHPPASPAH